MSCVSFSCPWPVFSVGQRSHSTASCFLPLLLEKDFRPPKGVIPNAKQHWQQPSFLACIFNPPCATKVAFWFFPSLFTLTHTHSPSQDRILLLFSPLQSLLIGIQHCPVRLHLPATKHQTGSTQPGRSGLCKHWSSSQQPTTNGWTPTSHTSATSSQAHLLSILAFIPADRYDVSPLKSPGTYL